MKKLIVCILCFMLLVVPLSVSAEEATDGVVEGETVDGEVVEPPVEENPVEEEIQGDGETVAPEGKPSDDLETELEEARNTVSDIIVAWVTENAEEIGVVITLIGYGIVLFKKLATILQSAGTINNNAITITEKSSDFMNQALNKIEATSDVVKGYDIRIAEILEAFCRTAEDKQNLETLNKRLETELMEIKNYLKISADANIEFANELCELLALANIPNFKKESIGAAHLERVNAILEAEKKAEAATGLVDVEEAKEDVGEEKEN